MKKKQNTLTFAQRAKALQKKYTRADWDEMEKTELMDALAALREEQEQFRMENGMVEQEEAPMESYAGGGPVRPNSENVFDPMQYLQQSYAQAFPTVNPVSGQPTMNPVSGFNAGISPTGVEMPVNKGMEFHKPTGYMEARTPQIAPKLDSGMKHLYNPADANETGRWRSPETSALPMAISTGVSLLGNLLGARRAKKLGETGQVNLPRMNAEEISLEREREAARRQAGTATNIALRAGRDVSSGGNRYANQIAGVSGIMDSLGARESASYLNEETTNAQFAQQAGATNAQLGAQEAMFNAQQKMGAQGLRSQYLDNAFAAIPQGMADYRSAKSNDMLMATLGKDYGLYEPIPANETWKQKLLRQLSGPAYSVRNREGILNQ